MNRKYKKQYLFEVEICNIILFTVSFDQQSVLVE